MKQIPLILAAGLLLAACGDSPEQPQERTTTAPAHSATATSVVEFRRGRLAMPSAHPEHGKPFSPSSAADKALVDAALPMLSSKSSAAEVEAQLTQLRQLESAELLRVAHALMQHSEPDARLAGLTLVEGYASQELLPLIQKAQRDTAEEVRIQAMELAQYVLSPEITSTLAPALRDPHPSVRHLALQSALKQDATSRETLLDAAASSPMPDMALAALAHTEASPKKANIGRFFQALDHADASVRAQSHEVLALTLHQSFPDARSAQAWWQQHSSSFNEDMVLTDTALATQLAR